MNSDIKHFRHKLSSHQQIYNELLQLIHSVCSQSEATTSGVQCCMMRLTALTQSSLTDHTKSDIYFKPDMISKVFQVNAAICQTQKYDAETISKLTNQRVGAITIALQGAEKPCTSQLGNPVLLSKTPIELCFSNKAVENTREKQPRVHIILWIAISTTIGLRTEIWTN